jgi:Na+/H+ antiporter NhaC
MNCANSSGRLLALTPFLVFVGLYTASLWLVGFDISPLPFVMAAIGFSFFTFRDKLSLNKKIEVFVLGSSRQTIMTMVYIFIFTSVFTYILKLIGGIDAAVRIGLWIIPSGFLLPGFFMTVGLFATAIGSSMGTIAAFMPIGVGLAQKLGIDPSLMAGIVVSGAMLGDNLSIISDTTIAATQTLGCRMVDKFWANLALVLPAFVGTMGILFWVGNSLLVGTPLSLAPVTSTDAIRVIPYLFVFILALAGVDVIGVLVMSIVVAIGIGVQLEYFGWYRGASLLLEGFSKNEGGIHEVLVLSLCIAGLAYIVEYNGGLSYLLQKFSKKITSSGRGEVAIACLIMLVNAAVAINTVAILICGPVAKKIADYVGISPKRAACLLDIYSCFMQGILPYAPQLLLASSIAGVTSISIMPYLYYQGLILVVTTISIVVTLMQEKPAA